MSVPYGSPPAAQQPSSPGVAASGPNLGLVLGLVGLGLSLVIYACSYAEDAIVVSATYLLPLFLISGLLAGAGILPKAPRLGLLVPSAVLAAAATLVVLQTMMSDNSLTGSSDVGGMLVIVFIAGLLQTAAVVGALLVEAGVIKLTPKPAYGQPGGWNPQSGSFPQQGYGQQGPAQPGYGQQSQYPQTGGQFPPTGGQQYGGQPQTSGQPAQPAGGSAGDRSAPQFGQQPFGQAPYGGQQQGGQQQGGGGYGG